VPAPELSPAVIDLLRRPNPAVMATIGPDGAPRSVATWYLWDEGRILLSLDARRTRLDDLRRDPRMSLTVLDSKDWYGHVSIRGTVTLEDDPELAAIDRLSQHYRGRPYPDRKRPRVTAWMTVERVHTWRR
jgi:PPOX class probable F420-dependent enzyme